MKIPNDFVKLVSVFCLIFSLDCTAQEGISGRTPIPFKADFIGNYTYVGPDTLAEAKCNETLSAWRAIVDGEGTSSYLGDFIVHFDFCGDEAGNYGNLYGYMVSAAGDTLFVSCAGQVKEGRLADHQAHVTSYWRDPFEIKGGTGKFKGASGGGTTNDYNSTEDTNSHHHWNGTITLKNEEQ